MQWTLFIAHRRNMIVGDEVKIIWTVLCTVFIFWLLVSQMHLDICSELKTKPKIWSGTLVKSHWNRHFHNRLVEYCTFYGHFNYFFWFSRNLILTMGLGSFTGYKSEVKCTTDIGSLPPTSLALTLVENISEHLLICVIHF